MPCVQRTSSQTSGKSEPEALAEFVGLATELRCIDLFKEAIGALFLFQGSRKFRLLRCPDHFSTAACRERLIDLDVDGVRDQSGRGQ